MAYMASHCDFCGEYVDERGKKTRTNALCYDHLNKSTSIPKVSGKKVLTDGGHPSSIPTFGGGTGFKKSGTAGSGF